MKESKKPQPIRFASPHTVKEAAEKPKMKNKSLDPLPPPADMPPRPQTEKKTGKPNKKKFKKEASVKEASVKEGAEKPGAKDPLKEISTQYLYLKAEFENYKKQALKEQSELIRFAGENFIRALVEEFLDDFERAFENLEKGGDLKNFEQGMQLIYKNVQKMLSRFQVQAHDPKGKPFDPRFHEALSRQATDKAPKNSVLATFKKAYTLNGKLIRPAQVAVAVEAAGETKDRS